MIERDGSEDEQFGNDRNIVGGSEECDTVASLDDRIRSSMAGDDDNTLPPQEIGSPVITPAPSTDVRSQICNVM